MTRAASMVPAGPRDLKTVRPVSLSFLLKISFVQNKPIGLQKAIKNKRKLLNDF